MMTTCSRPSISTAPPALLAALLAGLATASCTTPSARPRLTEAALAPQTASPKTRTSRVGFTGSLIDGAGRRHHRRRCRIPWRDGERPLPLPGRRSAAAIGAESEENSFSTSGFGLQATVGAEYALSDRLSLGLEGRYFRAFAEDYESEVGPAIRYDADYDRLEALLSLTRRF